MNPILRNILAVVAGWIGGSMVNMGLLKMGHSILPIEGIDTNSLTELAEIMPTLEPKYFLFPFLAHALGTLVGALIAGIIAMGNKMKLALVVGFLFLLGGIAVNYMLPGPTWFAETDIVQSYIPMAVLCGKIAINLENTLKI